MKVVNVFQPKWVSARGINGDIRHKTKTELDANLKLFYAEARIKTEKTTVEAHCWDLGMIESAIWTIPRARKASTFLPIRQSSSPTKC